MMEKVPLTPPRYLLTRICQQLSRHVTERLAWKPNIRSSRAWPGFLARGALSGAKQQKERYFERVMRREAPPIQLWLGSGAQPYKFGDKAPGKFPGLYVNFRPVEHL